MNNEGLKSENSSANITREELHVRHIDLRGFLRSDGLFEVEGRVVDRKTRDQQTSLGRIIPAGTSVHDMGVRLVYDENLVVHDVQTFTDAAPYDACPSGGLALQNLKGLRMTSGWNKEIRSRIAKEKSCTHLVELLGPIATVAFQSLSSHRRTSQDAVDASGRPLKIDSCYAYAADGELVKAHWPEFHRSTLPE